MSAMQMITTLYPNNFTKFVKLIATQTSSINLSIS